jgi:hypothetical protein
MTQAVYFEGVLFLDIKRFNFFRVYLSEAVQTSINVNSHNLGVYVYIYI